MVLPSTKYTIHVTTHKAFNLQSKQYPDCSFLKYIFVNYLCCHFSAETYNEVQGVKNTKIPCSLPCSPLPPPPVYLK